MTASTSCFIGHSVFHRKCKHCKTFQNDWYNQVEISGFKDIEGKGNTFTDHGSAYEIVKRHKEFHTQVTYEANFNYYQWAREKAMQGRFASYNDLVIWSRYAEGSSQYEIARKIKRTQGRINQKLKEIEAYLTIGSASCVYEPVLNI